ncbi:MAG TPA: hypothetical protein VD908_07275 [Cytophagales bacterium]|nr:hypothetical protein [Cytophagales bacterium]
MVRFLNLLINFFWTVLGFTAIFWYWYIYKTDFWFYIFLVVSILPVMLPESIVGRLQLSNRKTFYEKLGVRLIRKVVQNGDWTRYVSKQVHAIIKNPSQAKKYKNSILVYERYHILCFSFFFLTSIHCLASENYLFAGLIFISNLFYNVLAILLQQYNRVRISGSRRHKVK